MISDVQTHGRGRAGSSWVSPLGGLWVSIILRPGRRAKGLALIPVIASLAVIETLRDYGVNARIKWPNDIIVNDGKIAGILCESSVSREKFQWVIVGIGVNVNNQPPRMPSQDSKYKAVSMIQISGRETKLSSLAESIRGSLIRHYDKLQAGNEKVLLNEYNAQQTLRNGLLRIAVADKTLEGVAMEIDTEGRLNLETLEGTIHKIRSEDVLLLELL